MPQVLAQSESTPPPTSDPAGAASREQLLRRALKDALSDTNGIKQAAPELAASETQAGNSGPGAPAGANVVPGNAAAQPAFPAFPTPPPRRLPPRRIPALGSTN